jgi:hypothetical protein
VYYSVTSAFKISKTQYLKPDLKIKIMETEMLNIPIVEKLKVSRPAKIEQGVSSSCCTPKNDAVKCCSPSKTSEENNGACCAQPDDGSACCSK